MRKFILSLSCAIAATVALNVRAADFVTRTYPLSVDVEDQYIQSSIYLRLEVKDYHEPFADFARRQHDDYEAAFAAFVKALQNDDEASAAKMLRPGRPLAANDGAEAQNARPVSQVVATYRKAFAGMKDVTVVAQALIGSSHLFIWEARGGMVEIRRGFIVEGAGDSISVREVTSADPVAVIVLNNVMNAMRAAPQAYRALSARSTAFVYPLPVGGEAPVVMQFGGGRADTNPSAMAAGASPVNAEILRLYADTAEALRLGATERLLANFTARSAEKLRDYLAAVSEDSYDAYPDLAWQRKRVRLVLGSDPVYIVYSTMGDEDSSYTYDYVVRDSKTNTLRFANIARRGLMDNLLMRQELFDPARLVGKPAVAQ